MTESRTSVSRTRALIAGATLVGLAACGVEPTVSNPSCSPSAVNHRYDLPRPTVGKMLAYRLDPSTIVYHYIDVRSGDTTEYTWNTARDYYGLACLRFATTDSARVDSSGAFQLVMSGSNNAYMDRHLVTVGQTTSDSVLGSVFYGCEGDGGTFHLAPDSAISFTWANGDARWIFNPSALHKLHPDTLFSSFSQSAYGDSVRSTQRFAWVRTECGEGF